jgi:hypothetical protein
MLELQDFPDFSSMRKLEIWCEIYFGRSVLIAFSGGNRLPRVADAALACGLDRRETNLGKQ